MEAPGLLRREPEKSTEAAVHFASIKVVEAGNSQEALQGARSLLARLAPDLEETSSMYRAGMVILLSQVVGQGVHKLARVLGYPTEFVARCARRLVDNGVWPDDLACLEGEGEEAIESFWFDVGVAEGKLCRRRDETGKLQWAPAGHWWKDFDFTLGRTVTEGVVRYKPATVVPTTMLRDDMCDPSEIEDEEEEAPQIIAPVAVKPLPRPGTPTTVRAHNPVAIGEVVVLGAEVSSARWLS